MRTVYRQDAAGWVRVLRCQSFAHACREAERLTRETGIPHCVNS